MPGKRGRRLVVLMAGLTLIAATATAEAATERIAASKSRAVAGAPAGLGATVAKKKKKKKKKGPVATTQSSQVAFGSGTTVSSVASCTGKTHISGGGFSVFPSFTPPGTGVRSVTSTSHPTGPTGWSASGSAFSTPLSSGGFTTYARCESNRVGKLAGILSSSVTLVPAQSQTFRFNCPPRTHVLSGGYAGAGIVAFTPAPGNFRIIPLQSHRNGPSQWIVQASNSSNPQSTAATLTGYAICEQNRKGRTVSEVSTFSALVNDARTTGDPTCTGKRHVVSGGFLLAPNAPGPAGIPVASIDEFQPVGSKTWHLGLHESTLHALPAGSSLQSFAYCAPNKPPKKKKKKRKR